MELTEQQIKLLEDMIQRRITNTGESREQASKHISAYLKFRAT